MTIEWAGYEFEGPHKLVDWEAPRKAAVYVISHKPNPVQKPKRHKNTYTGETENLSERGFPWGHEESDCWIDEAGGKDNVYISLHFMPGSTEEERQDVEADIIDEYDPACN